MRRGHGRKGKSPGREAGRCGERRRGEDGLGLPCVILSAPLRSSPCRPGSQASAATCATHLSTHSYMVIFILCFVIPRGRQSSVVLGAVVGVSCQLWPES